MACVSPACDHLRQEGLHFGGVGRGDVEAGVQLLLPDARADGGDQSRLAIRLPAEPGRSGWRWWSCRRCRSRRSSSAAGRGSRGRPPPAAPVPAGCQPPGYKELTARAGLLYRLPPRRRWRWPAGCSGARRRARRDRLRISIRVSPCAKSALMPLIVRVFPAVTCADPGRLRIKLESRVELDFTILTWTDFIPQRTKRPRRNFLFLCGLCDLRVLKKIARLVDKRLFDTHS